MRQFLSRAALLAALGGLLATPAARAQTLGSALGRAKARLSPPMAPATTAAAVAQAAPGSTSPIPDSPPTNGLNVENQQEFARAVLANHRPWALGEHVGDDDYFYRYLRDEDKMPVKFTWDQGFVQFITPKGRYLWFTIEDMCSVLYQKGSPAEPGTRYFRAKMAKVREIHLTTTTQPLRPADVGYGTGYKLSFNPATGVLTAAAGAAGTRGISNFSEVDNDLTRCIEEQVK